MEHIEYDETIDMDDTYIMDPSVEDIVLSVCVINICQLQPKLRRCRNPPLMLRPLCPVKPGFRAMKITKRRMVKRGDKKVTT